MNKCWLWFSFSWWEIWCNKNTHFFNLTKTLYTLPLKSLYLFHGRVCWKHSIFCVAPQPALPSTMNWNNHVHQLHVCKLKLFNALFELQVLMLSKTSIFCTQDCMYNRILYLWLHYHKTLSADYKWSTTLNSDNIILSWNVHKNNNIGAHVHHRAVTIELWSNPYKWDIYNTRYIQTVTWHEGLLYVEYGWLTCHSMTWQKIRSTQEHNMNEKFQ